MKFINRNIWVMFLGLVSFQLSAGISLPAFFADHMVLQRDKPIVIWGQASFEKKVMVKFDNVSKQAEIDKNGMFSVTFPPLPTGGLHAIEVAGSQKIQINDILIGDVFIVGGQSNMEWPTRLINNAEAEMADAEYPMIRLFTVPKTLKSKKSLTLQSDGWYLCSKSAVEDFSAIGFFVARSLHKEKNIPIGVIDNSWGGSNIMGWLPEEAFEGLDKYAPMIKEFKEIHPNDLSIGEATFSWADGLDKNDIGIAQAWSESEVSKESWAKINVPGVWENNGYPNKDGIFWFAKDMVFAEEPTTDCLLSLGKIDDGDITYLNGLAVGSMDGAYNIPRYYKIDKGDIKKGINKLVVRVKDTGGGGGFHSPSDSLFCQCGKQIVSLSGEWRIAEGTKNYAPLPKSLDFNAYPTNRYNEMVHPLTGLAVKSYLYYQGESDAYQPEEYKELLKRKILTYRTNFEDNNLPFVIVQLASFMKEDIDPVKYSDWAELRLAQAMSEALPYVGMVSAIDVGEAEDIHPKDKQTVAKRALAVVKRLAYNEPVTYNGPKVEKVLKSEVGTLITFTNVGEGLMVKGDQLNINGFVIKLKDGSVKRVKAKKQSKTAVLLDFVGDFASIRYLYANNPGKVQIYNSQNFPAEPFEYKQ
jgi:sialate O-acetylesterase